MLKNFKFVSITLTIVFALAAFAFGQGRFGTIEGTISDANGDVIPGATVTVENSGNTTGFKQTVTADGSGYFSVRVAPGTYKVSATSDNFETSTRTVTVVLDKATSASMSIKPGAGTTVVDVTSDTAVIVDLGDTKIDTSITKEVIDALPKGTAFTSLLKIAPNVRPEALGAGPNIDGASGAENVYVVDGQEVTNFRTGQLNASNNLPFEFLQEVQIKSTGFEAEYGGATGGVINAVTAGGNDNWRGSLGISFEPAKFQGGLSPSLNRYGTGAGQFDYFDRLKDGGTNYFPVASISGPIIKGKMWGMLNYAPQIFETDRTTEFYDTDEPGRQVIGSENYSASQRNEQYFARIDAQPTDRIRMFGTFLYNPVIIDGNLPGTTQGLVGGNSTSVAQYAALGGRQNSNSVNGQVTWTATDKVILNFRAGRSFLNEKQGAYGIVPSTRYQCNISPEDVPGANCSAGFLTAPNTVQKFDVSTRTTFDADASFVGINAGGRHNIKVGYQLNRLFNDVEQGYTDTGLIQLYYTLPINSLGVPITPTGRTDANPTGFCGNPNYVPGDPCNWGSGRMTRFGTIGSATSKNQAFYAQDSWRVTDRFNLNFGLRVESEVVPSFGDAATTKAIEFGWGDKLAPRFGASYDLTGDGKTKLFASYGWFYDRFKYELPRGSFGGDFFRRDYFEILGSRGVAYTDYTFANILGGRADEIGGTCPIVGGPGYSLCQFDFRIATNSIGADIFETGAVDPDIKAARQSEYTFGLERELGNNFVFAGRYTHKQIDRAVEDVGVFNEAGSEAYIIGNPGLGLVCEISTSANQPCTKAERTYNAVELRVDKRVAKYFFNFSYTYSQLRGNYSGLASSDEFGRSSPNVNRFFDLPPLGYTANGVPDNGPLATDRPHVVKAFGGYTFDWAKNGINTTTVSGFTTFQSGTPVTTIYNLYSLGTTILYGRGNLGRTPMFSESDFSISHTYKFGRENRFSIVPYLDIRNLFDENNILTYQTNISDTNFTAGTLTNPGGCTTCANEAAVFNTIFNGGGIQQFVEAFLTNRGVSSTGTRNDYNQANSFQAGRNVRFGFRFVF